jgi:hypothetical protein
MKTEDTQITVILFTALLLVTLASIPLQYPLQQVQAQQVEQTQTSVPHTAKGHESHQVVNLQNPTEGIIYTGKVIFNSSKPVDMIAYEDITGQTFNITGTLWDVDGKQYAAKTLMKNATEGTANFQGVGILTHAASSDPYQVTFSINANPITTSGS